MTEAETVRDMAPRGLEAPLDAQEPDGEARSRLPQAAGLRARRHREDGLLRLLPDRRRLHPVGEGAGHSRRARARLGRRLGRRLGAADHRPRPAALRPAVRALPEPRARLDAGLRHRLLPGPARRGDRLRPPRIRRRTASAQIITFGKLQAKAAVRDVGRVLGMPYGQVDRDRRADPVQPRQAGDPAAGDRRRAAAAGDARRRTSRSPACWTSPASWRACTATPPPTPPAW